MWSKRGVLFGLVIMSLGFAIAGFLPSPKASATTGINQEMSFEGKIVNASGVNIADGSYNMEFKIYTAAGTCNPSTGVGCTLGWTEDWLVSNSQAVTTSSGTFEVNLDSVAANNFSGIDFNSYPLYLSIQVGSTSSCTPAGNFQANCGGDGEMKPYILLTASPYAINAGELGGLTASQFGQTAASQTFTGTNTFQPTTNITGVKILQNSSGSFGQDVFDVQGSSGGTNNFIQVTSTAANQGAVTIQSLGANNLNLNSGSNTISVGATNITGTAALTIAAASGQSLDLESGTTANVTLGTSANNKTVNIGAVGSTANTTTLNLATSTGAAQTVNAGSTNAGSSVALTGGATKETIANSGDTIQTTTDSTTAFQLQNSSGQSLLIANTAGSNQNNLITNASIESAISGNWTTEGTGATATQTTSQSLYGSNSLQIGSGSGTTGGASQKLTSTLTVGTQYNILFYAKGNAISSTPTVIKAVYSVDGSTQSVACANTLTLEYRSWQKYTCTFIPTGSPTSNNAIFIEATTASQTFYIDGVLVQQSSLADANYREGQLSVQAVIASPLLLQDNADSTNAFSVENKDGAQVFNVDTTDPDNLVDNPSFEVNTTNWSAVGTSPSITRDTSQQKYGLASLKVVSGSAANGGARYTFPSALATGTYTISFSFYSTTATDYTSVQVGYNNGSTDAFATCANASLTPTPVGTSSGVWMRYACSGVSLTTPASILITMSTATHTFFIDGVQVQSGSVASGYGLGQISISAPIVTPLQLKNQSDSNHAVYIQNAAGNAMFAVDTADKLIQVGSATTDTTQINLALDQSSTFADTGTCNTTPSSPNGALYYNTATNAIRACINSGWEDIATTAGLGIMLYGVVPDSGAVPGDLESTSTAGVSGPCKVSWASATSVTVQACSAYSGGRKITQSQVTVTLPAMAINQFTHLCYWSGGAATGPITNATSWFTTASTTETANLPTFSANNPVVCLATIKNSGSTANTIGQIFDTRVFTTSTKQFTNGSVALAPGWLTIFTTTDTTKVTTTSTAATVGIAGVVVTGSASAWSSGGPNAIIATGGPVEIEALAGATSAYNYIETGSTAGYATTAVAPTATIFLPNKYIGLAMTAFGSCATPSASACQGSIYTQIQWMDG